MIAPETLAAVVAALGVLVAPTGRTSPSAVPAIAAPRCESGYASGADLDERLSRATRDLLACLRRDAIEPRVARRALAAIATLRDTSAYDQRRGWGNLTIGRERRGSARLASIMRSAGL
ncbi:hypothetical protein [Sphingomonas sp. CROZ-RG-20F-R02-07]|uniref:hypothetical protein n=1 Tax=Sphingomonas sp. CROZ-RG-20F-R02-07 TaxID=2914832 RepID=UPI001F59D9D6|nr:hypothetical protein [Sphingomonas sp. CROZ-RG-20F-R02-07]